MTDNVENIGYDVHKQMLSIVQGNPFAFEDMTPAMRNYRLKPQLLTALLGGAIETSYGQTDTFKFDYINARNIPLPSGKAYDQKGPDIGKGQASMKYFQIPSFGLRFNVSPEDVAARREPGTENLATVAGEVSRLTEDSQDAFSMFHELALAQLLTTDTNIIRGGPFTEYNYYTEFIGGSRPAKIDMELDSSTVNHEETFRKQKHLLTQDVMRAGVSSSGFMCLCGDTFFNKRYDIENPSGLGREIRNVLDPASMPIPSSRYGSDPFFYDNFTGARDGILYINYGATIIAGTKLIADTDAYLMPLGVGNWMFKAYAPARTMTYVNTRAQEMYSWTNTEEWQGVTTYFDTNVLYGNKRPEFIRALKTT